MFGQKHKIANNREKKRRKAIRRFLVIIVLLTPAAIIISWLSLSCQQPAELEVDFLDVGQGDATLIKTSRGQTILIDGGPDNKVLRRLGKNLPFYRRRIDLVIISHYHDDHVIGLLEVLRRYRVRKMIYAENSSNRPVSAALLFKKAATEKIPVITIDRRATWHLGDNCYFDLLNPAALGIKIDPNNSLVIKLACAGKKFLFSGDNSAAVEKALLASDFDLTADVFKASHHGSNSANSEIFLQAVDPKLLVIPVGADNKFGHPSQKILERAVSQSIDIRRTDQAGDVRIYSTIKKP